MYTLSSTITTQWCYHTMSREENKHNSHQGNLNISVKVIIIPRAIISTQITVVKRKCLNIITSCYDLRSLQYKGKTILCINKSHSRIIRLATLADYEADRF